MVLEWNSYKEREHLNDGDVKHISAKTFTLKELEVATKNFNAGYFLGEGGFGRVYKGKLESSGQVGFVKFVRISIT